VRPSGLRPRLVAVLALALPPLVALAGALVWLQRAGGLEPDRAPRLGTVAVGLGAIGVGLGLSACIAGRRVFRTLRRMRRETELMSTVNPGYRLRIPGGGELGLLAAEINQLADRLLEARGGLEREVARATGELTVERSKLSAVLEALGEGVAVVLPDGRITLANRAAHRLLGAAQGGLLGRSLFDFVDRAKVAHFFERLGPAHAGAERFSLRPAEEVLLQTVMTPFFDDSGRMIGFILVLRDATRPARLDEERDRRVAEALRTLRGPLAAVRSLSESLLADPSSVSGTARRLVAAIQAEALRLSSVVTEMDEPVRLMPASRHFEVVAFGDLAAVTLRRLPPGSDRMVMVEADGDASTLPALTAEVSALSEALAHVLNAVLARRTPPNRRAWLRLTPRGRVLQLDVGAPGREPVAGLETLLDVPVSLGMAGRATVREVVQRHAGEIWAYAEAGSVGFRMTLPAADPADPPVVPRSVIATRAGLVGAGTLSGVTGVDAGPPRPDFYDFSLFDEMGRHVASAERGRPLDELEYVVFDLETTGLHPDQGDRVVSIAGVRVRGGTVKRGELFDALVNPGRPIPAASTRFHGITDRMVADAPPVDVVLPAFLRFAEGRVLVGHQVWFDVGFLGVEATRVGLPPVTLSHPILDTLSLSEAVHGGLSDHGLDAVAARLGVAVTGRHSALGDALATAEVFVRLIELLKRRGMLRLGDVIDAAREVEASRLGDVTPGAGP
jgi:DNA polymerase-3 subunit epsilon